MGSTGYRVDCRILRTSKQDRGDEKIGTTRLTLTGLIHRTLRLSFLLASGLILALSPLTSGPFGTSTILKPYLPTSAHKAHGYLLAQGDLARSVVGQAWLTRSEQALFEPEAVSTPFEMTGSFRSAEPAAFGYKFPAKSGKRIEVELELGEDEVPPEVFVDLYRLEAGQPVYVASGPPAPATGAPERTRRIELDLLQDADYVLRIQPELESAGRFELRIRAAPRLEFPVDGFDTRAIQSGFGAARDGGARSHHGVDIFAPRGTPAVAAVDARVSRVQQTGRGGNVVWLKPLFGNLRLYYAHLDSQAVKPGQYVFAGETIGTVGNTGNARTTPPHLHFGVYVRRRGGAWDPYPFLK